MQNRSIYSKLVSSFDHDSNNNDNSYLITGGAGFIGSRLINLLFSLSYSNIDKIVVIDNLSLTGRFDYLLSMDNIPGKVMIHFYQRDINDKDTVLEILRSQKINKIVHLAAQTHVDHSITNPDSFISSNINGTYQLLQAYLEYYKSLSDIEKQNISFLHMSTDEVYGDLASSQHKSIELDTIYPSSPYSASKASAEALVLAWKRTYKLPLTVARVSNNFGEGQYPEKLIPKIINHAIQGKAIPVYGNGKQERDWLYVEDCVNALFLLVNKPDLQHSIYNVGSGRTITNIDIINQVLEVLERYLPAKSNKNLGWADAKYTDLIKHVPDRLGHDIRYCLNTELIRNELHWEATTSLDKAIVNTVEWYLHNPQWFEHINKKESKRKPHKQFKTP